MFDQSFYQPLSRTVSRMSRSWTKLTSASTGDLPIGKDLVPPQYANRFAQAGGPERIFVHQCLGLRWGGNINEPGAACACVAVKQGACSLDTGGVSVEKREVIGHLFCPHMIVTGRVFEQDEIGHDVSFSC